MKLVNVMLYSSVHNEKIKELKKLNEKKYRDQTNLFLVEGKHLVEEAKKYGVLKETYVLEGSGETGDHILSEKVMKFVTQMDSIPKLIGVCEKKEGKLGNRIVILDGVQDPGNIGTIIRSMVAFHADTLILSEDCADVYAPKVIRATQGMIFQTNVFRGDLKNMIMTLKENDYFVFSTKVDGGKNIKSIVKKEKFAIIMGNEGNGVRQEILSLSDDYYYIPMKETCESLNVGVALSIFLYELDK